MKIEIEQQLKSTDRYENYLRLIKQNWIPKDLLYLGPRPSFSLIHHRNLIPAVKQVCSPCSDSINNCAERGQMDLIGFYEN